MGRAPELLEDQPGLGGRRSGGAVGMLCQLGEDAPHGARLEGYDDLGARFAANAIDDGEVVVQQLLIENITWSGQLAEVDHPKRNINSKTDAKITKSRTKPTGRREK
jgi:hypothetical protein